MSLSSKLAITDVDVKDKRVLMRVRLSRNHAGHLFSYEQIAKINALFR